MDPDARGRHLALNGGRIDARGVRITGDLLAHVLDAMPEVEGKKEVLEASFDSATFAGHVLIANVRFLGRTSFARATFEGDFRLRRAECTQRLMLPLAQCGGDVVLSARCPAGANLSGAHVEGRLQLTGGWNGEVNIVGTSVIGDADLGEIEGDARIDMTGVSCASDVRARGTCKTLSFDAADVRGELRISMTLSEDLSMSKAVVKGKTKVTRCVIPSDLVLSETQFETGLDLDKSDIGRLLVDQASFDGLASIQDVEVREKANFRFATFSDACRFRNVSFGNERLRATFRGEALFDRCRFSGNATFRGPSLGTT